MTDPWIARFKKDALPKIKRAFKPQKVILFGSRVRGDAHEGSDIDVIMISSAFSGVPFVNRMAMVARKVRFPKHIDYLCYTPAEFRRIKTESAIIMDALDNAMVVAG